eukprot:TRINITY_DN26910_c0_g2_i1.p1 TRINITY_DN26910_c0_g2~~TRINITY_DN26910_c0_g2_i1.p1  ORF type:complete len:279 (+),score=28.98 TRINITY_DN26910_c0_g2_i1:140-976(+)
MYQPLSYNDGILIFSLLYSSIDLWYEWELFNTCIRPIHQWLLVSYACVICFRITHLLGMVGLEASGGVAADFFVDLRHKGTIPRFLALFVWFIALPFFILWTVMGSWWLWMVVDETPSCAPSTTHLWFSGLWMAICYVWIGIHFVLAGVAWSVERRVRRAETDLREIEDEDSVSRWGAMSSLAGYRSLTTNQDGAMTPSEIRELPCGTYPLKHFAVDGASMETECECSICINEFAVGDSVRRLPCGHTFHRPCVDLWLLRRADCPLCKRVVMSMSRKV